MKQENKNKTRMAQPKQNQQNLGTNAIQNPGSNDAPAVPEVPEAPKSEREIELEAKLAESQAALEESKNRNKEMKEAKVPSEGSKIKPGKGMAVIRAITPIRVPDKSSDTGYREVPAGEDAEVDEKQVGAYCDVIEGPFAFNGERSGEAKDHERFQYQRAKRVA